MVAVPYDPLLPDPDQIKTKVLSLLEDWEFWKQIPTVLTCIIVNYMVGKNHFTYCRREQNNWVVSLEIQDWKPIRWTHTPDSHIPPGIKFISQFVNDSMLASDLKGEYGVTVGTNHFSKMGQLLVIGSFLFHMFFRPNYPYAPKCCSKFNIVDQTWCEMAQPKGGEAVGGNAVTIVVVDSQIFCFGGSHSSTTNQVYDLAKNSWRQLEPLPHHRAGAAGVLLPDNRTVIIMGGTINPYHDHGKRWRRDTDSVLFYDLILNKFTKSEWRLPEPLSYISAHVHEDCLFITLRDAQKEHGFFMSLHKPGAWFSFRLLN